MRTGRKGLCPSETGGHPAHCPAPAHWGRDKAQAPPPKWDSCQAPGSATLRFAGQSLPAFLSHGSPPACRLPDLTTLPEKPLSLSSLPRATGDTATAPGPARLAKENRAAEARFLRSYSVTARPSRRGRGRPRAWPGAGVPIQA